MLSTMDLEEHQQAQSINNFAHATKAVEETNTPDIDDGGEYNNENDTLCPPEHPQEASSKDPHEQSTFTNDQKPLQSPLVREQLKFCANLLKGLKRHPQSSPFQVPVDPVALGIPDYPTIIKHPMDLGTIAKKLEANEYETAQGFIEDVRLMLSNCFTFNAAETQVYAMGKALEKYFENTLGKMPTELSMAAASNSIAAANNHSGHETPKRRKSDVLSSSFASSIHRPKRESITPKRSNSSTPISAGAGGMKRGNAELSFCSNLLRELYKKAHAHLTWPFLEPVDPIRLGIPDYFDVIKTPMDMSTIRKKLETGQYNTAEQFEADFRLMLTNCFTYNAPDSDVVQLGRSLEAVFDKKWAQRATASKVATSHHHHHHQQHYDEDDDSDSEKILALNRKIQALQQELNELLMKRKRRGGSSSGPSAPSHHHHQSSTHAKPAASATSSKPRTPKTPSAHAQFMSTPMTFEEKRQLSIDVNNLTPERLGRVVEIIHASMPNLKQDADSEVIELDIESLDVRTLRELQKYVHECKIAAGLLPPGAPLPGLVKKRKAAPSTTTKKNVVGSQQPPAAAAASAASSHPGQSALAAAAPMTDDSESSCSDDDLA